MFRHRKHPSAFHFNNDEQRVRGIAHTNCDATCHMPAPMSVRTGDTTADTVANVNGVPAMPSAERRVSDEATREWQHIEQTTPTWHLHSVRSFVLCLNSLSSFLLQVNQSTHSCPTKYRLFRSWQCTVSLRFIIDNKGQSLGQARTKASVLQYTIKRRGRTDSACPTCDFES